MPNKITFKSLFSTLAFISIGIMSQASYGQTRENGPWWPSVHGAADQAGATNYITPEKILQALQMPTTGQTYELGHIYEASMPQYRIRPYYITTHPTAPPTAAGQRAPHRDYFTGYIGQMGTQIDAFGHQGISVEMDDGSFESVFL